MIVKEKYEITWPNTSRAMKDAEMTKQLYLNMGWEAHLKKGEHHIRVIAYNTEERED